MRTKVFSVLFFLLVFAAASCVAAPGPLTGKIIALDPGHGGHPGAVANGVREADVNLAVALKLRDKLTAMGAAVVMTRTADQPATGCNSFDDLQFRVALAQNTNADVFVSLHSNSYHKAETAGAMTFYQSGRPTDLARAIQSGLVGEVGVVDKGVRPANFYVLRNSDIPAALVEMGFLTNQAEAARLANDSYQNELAEGVLKGLLSYFLSR